MNKKWVLLNAVLLAQVGFPSTPTAIQAADATTRIEVDFEGNQVFTTDQLRSAMSSSGKASEATRRSNTTDDFEQGLQRLREFLIGKGYITPRIGKPQTAQSPTGLIFTVHLEEGPLFRLGELKVTGV